MENTYEYYLNWGKSSFLKKDYLSAQMCFIKASELNPNFIPEVFEKVNNVPQYTMYTFRQECLDKGIEYILKDIEDSLSKTNLEDMFNPFERDLVLKDTQIYFILNDYISILNCCIEHSSKAYWTYEFRLLAEIYIKLEKCQIAYSYYKKILYFDRNNKVRPIFNKYVKIYGNDDKVDEINFNYKLLKNIYFKELNNVPTKNLKSKKRFELNGKFTTVEEIAINYYQNQGYNAIHSENWFWLSISDLFFNDLYLIDSKYREDVKRFCRCDPDIYFEEFNDPNLDVYRLNNPQSYLDELDNRIIEVKKDFKGFIKKYRQINNMYTDYIDILGIDKFMSIFDSMMLDKALKLSKELVSPNHYILSGVGFPDLIVWNEEKFFFVEVKSTNDQLSEEQKDRHFYISEELDIPIVIFMVNKKDKQIKEIKKHYLIK